ncbi:helix-turn-helix domain-containing protein [Companilactobacillus zhachilii]|uniref:helix-turn-helix domain-containing protein n=1 Tax=Companilactobacillus zhachilii TaxID=2304606 RepID=UPI001923F8B5|nr:helix-turn-helix domain-containing protein [Companilactobacillus zhachilii]MBL3531030.1 helix-turn-helix domain-containing protein [Companilactobacillus zhachilii]
MIDVQLRKIMAEKNISVSELARQIGISINTVQSIYSGKTTMIRLNTIDQVCNVLSITPNELFGYEDTKNDEPVYMDILKEISRKLDK